MDSKGINTAMVKVFARVVFVIVHIDGVMRKWYSQLFKTLNPEYKRVDIETFRRQQFEMRAKNKYDSKKSIL